MHAELRRQNESIPPTFQRLAQRLFRSAFDLDVGGIYKIDSEILGGVHDRMDVLLRHSVRPEPVRSESDHRHLNTGFA
tara:strand:- start:586 stop:819 length:234 start_codon:yes stop_codon:yes gene_type:complete